MARQGSQETSCTKNRYFRPTDNKHRFFEVLARWHRHPPIYSHPGSLSQLQYNKYRRGWHPGAARRRCRHTRRHKGRTGSKHGQAESIAGEKHGQVWTFVVLVLLEKVMAKTAGFCLFGAQVHKGSTDRKHGNAESVGRQKALAGEKHGQVWTWLQGRVVQLAAQREPSLPLFARRSGSQVCH